MLPHIRRPLVLLRQCFPLAGKRCFPEIHRGKIGGLPGNYVSEWKVGGETVLFANALTVS